MFTEITSSVSKQEYLSTDDVSQNSFDGMMIDFSAVLPALTSNSKGSTTSESVRPFLCGGGGGGSGGGGGGGGGGAC